MALPTDKTGKITKAEFFDHAVEINRVASAITAPLPILSKTTSYTLATEVLGASNLRLNFATDSTLLVPDDATVNFPVGTVVPFSSAGAGKVTIQSASSTATTTVALRASRIYTIGSNTANTYSVPMPAGIVNGDTVCVTFAIATSAPTWPTIPAAFTMAMLTGPSGAQQVTFVAKNVTATSFAANTTFDFTSGHINAATIAIVHVYSGADPVNPVDGVAPSTVSTSVTPAYPTKNPNALEIAIKASSTANTQTPPTWTAPSGMTLVQQGHTASTDTNSQLGIYIGPSVASPIGTIFGPRTFTPHIYGSASILALRPPNTPAVKINSFGGLRTLAGQYTSGALIKVAANEWDLDGYLV